MRPSDRWLALFAVLYFLSFPHPVGDAVVDLGAVASWLALACLLLGIRGLEPRAAAFRGWIAGGLAFALIFHWFYVVTVSYGGAHPIFGVLAPIGTGMILGSFTAAFAFACRALARRGATSVFLPALLWTVLEHVRSVFPVSGFPWATIGYAQHLNPAMLGLSSLTGVYGPSFATALAGALVAKLALREGNRIDLGAAACVVGGLLALGFAARPAPLPGPTLRIAAIQGNVDQGVKWSPDRADEILARYERLSRDAAGQGAELIVWPETAVPGAIEFDRRVRARLQVLARETGAALVVGGVGLEPIPDMRDAYLYFDSAFVFGPDGQRTDRYDKTHLVPFGEYVPLREFIGRFVDAIATGIAPGQVTAGERPRSVSLPLPPDAAARVGETPAGVPVCYELLFPDLVRRFAHDDSRVLLAITNDAWYGRTGAPHQFLAITALRSAESGSWTVRAANTGVSAIIDARGRVRDRTGLFEEGVLVADVPLRDRGDAGTFYVRHGDVFAWSCWAALALGICIALLRAAPSEETNE